MNKKLILRAIIMFRNIKYFERYNLLEFICILQSNVMTLQSHRCASYRGE